MTIQIQNFAVNKLPAKVIASPPQTHKMLADTLLDTNVQDILAHLQQESTVPTRELIRKLVNW